MGKLNQLQKAVHDHCLECSGGDKKLVDTCELVDCKLYHFRNSKAASICTEESAKKFVKGSRKAC